MQVEIGTGCTLRIGSDSYAYTVIAVRGVDIEVQADKAAPAEGHDYYSSQKYTFEPNPKGDVKRFRYHKDEWREVAKNEKARYVIVKRSSYRLLVGERNHYSDPSF
jgi:hypothetical protein